MPSTAERLEGIPINSGSDPAVKDAEQSIVTDILFRDNIGHGAVDQLDDQDGARRLWYARRSGHTSRAVGWWSGDHHNTGSESVWGECADRRADPKWADDAAGAVDLRHAAR